MKKIRSITSNRFHAAALSIALAVILLVGPLHPQTASAQRAGRGRGAAGGGRVRAGGVRMGGTGARGQAWYNPSTRLRPRMGGMNFAARRYAYAATSRRSSLRSSGGQSRQSVYRPLQRTGFPQTIRRSLAASGISTSPYNYGVPPHKLSGVGWAPYFPSRSVYYPHYYLNYTRGITVPSVYYYYGTFPAFIGAGNIISQPPPVAYVPYPTYTPDGLYQGNPGIPGDGTEPSPLYPQQNGGRRGGSSAPGVAEQDSALSAAILDITAAWNNADIRSLALHVRQDAPIAVYLRGKYYYSLSGENYLNMTRDAFSSTQTVSFTLDSVQRKGYGIYTVSGHHVYTDRAGKDHTVLVSYVLQKVEGDYYLSQVGSTPEKLED